MRHDPASFLGLENYEREREKNVFKTTQFSRKSCNLLVRNPPTRHACRRKNKSPRIGLREWTRKPAGGPTCEQADAVQGQPLAWKRSLSSWLQKCPLPCKFMRPRWCVREGQVFPIFWPHAGTSGRRYWRYRSDEPSRWGKYRVICYLLGLILLERLLNSFKNFFLVLQKMV